MLGFDMLEKFSFNKYKGMFDKVKELKLYKEEKVFKVHVKLEDGTEISSPLSNYKTIIETIAKSK